MEFKRLNWSEFNGTSRVGQIQISYNKLVEKLGEPDEGDDDKTDAEWDIKFQDGTIATIYNYKDGRNYLGPRGPAKEDITLWSIGGHSTNAAERVKELFDIQGCCIDKTYTRKTCMNLPDGFTCGDCFHETRCCSIFGHKPSDTYCDFFPNRFMSKLKVAE